MKKITIFAELILITSIAFAGTPTIDGAFDGEAVWGTPVATADGVAGWQGVNIDKIYVTYDSQYAYYCGLFISDGEPANWMRVAFAINVTTGGGGSDPWGDAVTYGYTPDDKKPDFVLIGRLGDTSDWAELRSWNGSNWDGGGTNIYGTDIAYAVDLSVIEGRILLSIMSNPADCDVQFYVSGNNPTQHGVFDACPDDEVAQDWNWPTTLDNYATDITLPVELSSFTASYVNEFVTIFWQTASETDVIGFNIYRSEEDDFSTASDPINECLIEGQGTTTIMNDYYFTDETADPYYTTYYYWLEVINLGGSRDVYGSIIYEPGDIDNNGEINFVSTQFDNCYPNPAILGNTIHFGFRVGGIELTNRHIELKVYNVLGKLVKEIVNEDRLVDDYTEQWTPKNLPNGVYFYQLRTDNYNEVKKMLLVK